MAWRKPLLEVRNAKGKNILPALGGLWLTVSVTDQAGKKSDQARIVCIGPPGAIEMPNKGDVFEILMGWEDEGLVLQGKFSFQKASAHGDPERGHTVTLTFRAADFVDKLKAQGREHYDDITYGDLMKKVAKKAGMEAEVDPDLAKIKMGYRIRWDQSLIDFATEASEEVGATLKPAGGKLVAMKRGGSKSGGGKDLEPIEIRFNACWGYDVEIDPRPEAGKVSAPYQDPKNGKRKHVTKSTGGEGPTTILRHPYRNEQDAGEAAEAEGYECRNASGSGSFEMPGLPRARAEAPVNVSGFGPPIDGAWKAESVEKTVTAKGGFTTSVSVKAGKDEKGKKKGATSK